MRVSGLEQAGKRFCFAFRDVKKFLKIAEVRNQKEY